RARCVTIQFTCITKSVDLSGDCRPTRRPSSRTPEKPYTRAMRFSIRSPGHRPFDENSSSLKIVKAAKQVFLRETDSGFSIRSVAKEAGLSMGAVQHFYPTRDKLLAAMLELVVNEYEAAYERVFSELPFNGEARLLGIIEYLALDITRAETRQFFFALWALGCRNKSVAALIEEMYSHHRRNLA